MMVQTGQLAEQAGVLPSGIRFNVKQGRLIERLRVEERCLDGRL